jgi:protein-S-isoprenylcysteine O-methyltransferase Ste14
VRERRQHRASARLLESAILIALPIVSHFLVPIATVIPTPWSYVGIGVMILGFALMAWAARSFREVGTGFDLQEGGAALVTAGPFRFSRNPMYLGMLIWLIGLAVFLGSLISFLYPLLFFVLVTLVVIPIEEQRLEETMGASYQTYQARVRRWL